MASGRDDAKRLIGGGVVSVDGSNMVKPATLVAETASITVTELEHPWASRGGLKLAHALTAFGIDPKGEAALDVGASTGGFTDVLLEHGASSVTAVDVGYGQMVWRLRSDPRVTILDRTNFRTMDLDLLGKPFDLVVIDVSFISVRLLADRLAEVGHEGADYVVLVKPQFEVGRDRVGRGGIVTDPADHGSAIAGVADALHAVGVGSLDVVPSPITGSKGNREFLLHAARNDGDTLDPDSIAGVAS